MGAEFPARGCDRFPQDDEPAVIAQGAAHDDLLGAEEGLIEAADRDEGVSGTEQKAACGQTQCPVEPGKERHQKLCIPRHFRVEFDRGAAADRAAAHRIDRGANDRYAHDRVRIDEDEQLARRCPSA